MKTWQLFKKWVSGGCIYFTVISMVIILINLLASGADSMDRIYTVSFLLMFPCGLCLSAAEMLLRANTVPRWIRLLSHYVITLLSVTLFLFLPSSSGVSSTTVMILLALLTLLYWVLFGLILLIRGRVKKLMEED